MYGVNFFISANDDFQASENRMLTLDPPLETPFCVNAINVINDIVFEDNEMLSLSLTLTDTLNEVNITHPRATIVIIDEDSKHTMECFSCPLV